MNRNRNVMTQAVVLFVFVVTLFLLFRKAIDSTEYVVRTPAIPPCVQTGSDASKTSSRRRYISTSDETRYILFGIGDGFSVYDQQVLEYIRSHVSRPSPQRLRQLAKNPQTKDVSQWGQPVFVDRLLSGRRGGFFVECGAADGEYFSNSLFFELERNWTGVLIEANPEYYPALLDKNRQAYVVRSCLSTERRPTTVRFLPAKDIGGIVDKIHPSHMIFVGEVNKTSPEIEVNCFPLNGIMAALNVFHVDYLSLDVEGPELEILRTVDWTRLQIDVITVEYRVYGGSKIGIDKSATLQKLVDLRQFFGDTGLYREVGLLPSDAAEDSGMDVVFSRTDLNVAL